MIQKLGIAPTSTAIADRYRRLIDSLIVAAANEKIAGLPGLATQTLMVDIDRGSNWHAVPSRSRKTFDNLAAFV